MQHIDDILISLKASYIRTSQIAEKEINRVKRIVQLDFHPSHLYALRYVKDYIRLEAEFEPLNPTGIESDGWLSIDTLFGVLNNKTGIVAMTKSLVNLIPPEFIVIGDSFGGGNFFGQFRGDRRIFYFNHEATYEGEELTLVADDFDSMLTALRPKPPLPDSDDDGIVKVVTSDEFTAAMERWKAEQETAPQPELHRSEQ